MELALHLRWRDIARPVWPRQGFVSFAKLEAFVAELLGDPVFADLEIPYAAMAADLATGEQVALTEGRVAPAVRASCSVPGIVTPVEIDGRPLVDGGVINNLPIAPVRALGADVVLAVGLGWPPGDYPKGPLRAGAAAIELLILHAGDDPASAEVFLPIPIWGLGTLVRTSKRHRFLSQGQQAAEQALPAIWAALE
jgi:NTE family protein